EKTKKVETKDFVPPWSKIPFKAEAIACSRTPYQIFLPAYFSEEKSSAPAIIVLLDPDKSAEPPQKLGTTSAIALITSPLTERVAIASVPSSYTGKLSCQSFGSSFFTACSNCSANSGYSFL